MGKKLRRIMSWMLTVVLVFTGINFGSINAKAEDYVKQDGDLKLYFKLPADTAASDWGFNVWEKADVTIRDAAAEGFTPTGWSSAVSGLKADTENEGWAYVIISGTVTGCQFVDTTGKSVYSCWNANIPKAGVDTVYFDPSAEKWYKEQALENEIVAPVLDDIYYVAGDAPFSWTISEIIAGEDMLMKETAEGSKVYTITKTGLTAGVHQYKILQDPGEFAWEHAYLDEDNMQYGNSIFTISKTTDTVTITLDKSTDTPKVTATVTPGEDEEYVWKEGDLKLYFKLPADTTASDWGFNVWEKADVEIRDAAAEGFIPTGWGTTQVSGLKADTENEGWAYIIINGTVAGCQFVDTAGKNVYSCWNANIPKAGVDTVYFDPSAEKWYKEQTLENEIAAPVLDDIYYVAGDAPFSWTISEIIAGEDMLMKETAEGSKVYTITKTGLAAGVHQYKILQDPEEFAWEHAYLDEDNMQYGNSIFTIADTTDVVTITLDKSTDTPKVTATVTAAPSKYAVTVMDGTCGDETEYEKGATVTVTANAPEEGKVFDKWTCDDESVVFADASSEVTTFVMPEKAVTIVANYKTAEPSKYAVMVTNGTSGDETEYEKGATVTVTANAPEEGKAFDKWTCDDESVVFADASSEVTTFVMPEKAVSVVANYKTLTYKVTFMDGDTVVSEQNVEYGQNATAPTDLEKEGFVLTWDKSYVNIKADTVVNAVWKEKGNNSFTVQFVSDGAVVDTQVVDSGSAAIAPELAKEGYTLSWDKDFSAVAEDMTVTAVWTVNKYTVTFKDGEKVIDTQEVEYGKDAKGPETEAKEGYTLSWDKEFTSIKADTTVNAVWTVNKYTVTFKDGEQVIDTQEVEYGKDAEAPAVSKTGYTLSWDKVFIAVKEDITVNAVWKVNTYTVKFNRNGGSKPSKSSIKVTYGKKYGTLPVSKRRGYTFAGWYTAKSGGSKVTSSSVMKKAAGHTLYARWTKVKVGKASIKKVSPTKKKMTVTLKKVSGAKGYEVVYSTNKKFKSAKKVRVTSTKAVVKKLKSKQTVYVKVRAYKTDSTGGRVYGSYSSVKKVTIK